MKTFKEYLTKLQEERIVTQEDDGGDGGVVSPPSGGDIVNDVVQNDTPTTPGLSTTDVLGKCDHKKDGVFGPGCFHLPTIWTIPSFRIPRKKRKKLKYSNIIKEDESFVMFTDLAKSSMLDILSDVFDIVHRINPDIKINLTKDYKFEGNEEEWLTSSKINDEDPTDINIALNIDGLYAFLYNNGMEDNPKEIDTQLRLYINYELALALIRYFIENNCNDSNFKMSSIEQDDIAKEYAKYKIKNYSDVFNSKLNEYMQNLI